MLLHKTTDMDPRIWWVLFVLLIVLLIVFTLYLVINLIKDFCIDAPQNQLNKYKFGKGDVEDLTRITALNAVNSKIKFVDEFGFNVSSDHSQFGSRRKQSLLPDIHEDSDVYSTVYSVGDIMEEVNEERRNSEAATRNIVTEAMRRNSLHNIPLRKYSLLLTDNTTKHGVSTDTIDFCDPSALEVLKEMENVLENAKEVDKEVEYFIGGSKNLKYYELNEKFIRCMIALCDIHCNEENLRKRKEEVKTYILNCQEKLKSKV